MPLSRREFLKSTVASAAVVTLPFHVSIAHASSVIQLGDASVSVVSDGNLVLPGNFIQPADYTAEQFEAFLANHSLGSGSYEPACNVSLWQREDKLVLFDVGSGPNFMPSAGKLYDSLEALDIDAADITDVIFTHAHPDHLWGLIDDFDELTFPEADYHIGATEWDYWRAEDTIDELPESRKVFAVGAQNRMEYIEDRIKLFNYGDEILPGIEAVDTAGHTPGHTSFALHSGSESVMVLGDAITHPVISFLKYDWPSGGDQNPVQAMQTRKKLLDRMSQEKMQMIGFHLPNSGIGYVERRDSAYRYVAHNG